MRIKKGKREPRDRVIITTARTPTYHDRKKTHLDFPVKWAKTFLFFAQASLGRIVRLITERALI